MINIEKKINKLKDYMPELIVLFAYMAGLIVVMIFHEPWYDEAQAWLIAREASLKDILFLLPHYEGHPPLWHLILLPFAKSGMPYEFSIKFVSFIFSSASVYLILFKSPFPKKIKLLLPFNYFIFYQYGVLSRPYCILLFGFMLAAIYYKDKEEHPFRFILTLVLICSTSAYGIVLCGGICIVWVIEIIKKIRCIEDLKKFINTKTFYYLTGLFIYNMLLIIGIIPESDTYAISNISEKKNYVLNVIYNFFILPGDAVYLDIFNYTITLTKFNITHIIGIIGSSIIIVAITIYTKKKGKILLLLIPYVLFALFASFVYLHPHHIGIMTIFYIFLLWCCLESAEESSKNYFIYKLIKKESDKRLIKNAFKYFIFLVLIISTFYSLTASIHDISKPYGEGRELAQFIKDNKLDKCKIFSEWKRYHDPDTKEEKYETHLVANLAALPYFDKNIFYNFNDKKEAYLTHKTKRNDEAIVRINKDGIPDVVIGYSNLKFIFNDKISYKDYTCVYVSEGSYIWKTNIEDLYYFVYVRNDLLKNYPNLKHVKVENDLDKYNG